MLCELRKMYLRYYLHGGFKVHWSGPFVQWPETGGSQTMGRVSWNT